MLRDREPPPLRRFWTVRFTSIGARRSSPWFPAAMSIFSASPRRCSPHDAGRDRRRRRESGLLPRSRGPKPAGDGVGLAAGGERHLRASWLASPGGVDRDRAVLGEHLSQFPP